MVCGARMQIFPHPSQFLSLRETGLWVNADLRGKWHRGLGLLGNADLINPHFAEYYCGGLACPVESGGAACCRGCSDAGGTISD